MNYKCSHCVTPDELFINFDMSRFPYTQRQARKIFKSETKEIAMGKIFNYCLYLILLDIINNNIIFALPNNWGYGAEIAMKVFEGDKFWELYHKGKFDDIDFIYSNFKAYQIFYTYETSTGVREKPIYVSHNLKDIITDYTNKGRTYF